MCRVTWSRATRGLPSRCPGEFAPCWPVRRFTTPAGWPMSSRTWFVKTLCCALVSAAPLVVGRRSAADGVALAGTALLVVGALHQNRRLSEAVRLSLTDDLTGLANRRALLAELDQALHDGQPLGLMLVDLDDFKTINDTYGHATGDAVLRVVASRLVHSLGPGVTLARLGGDEFAVVLHHDGVEELLNDAHRLRGDLSRPIITEALSLTVAASAGLTTRAAGDTSPVSLLDRADHALYQAKAGEGAAFGEAGT
jgi:diguanylate cyclase